MVLEGMEGGEVARTGTTNNNGCRTPSSDSRHALEEMRGGEGFVQKLNSLHLDERGCFAAHPSVEVLLGE